jgi:murein L,D-transpeptidase YcbB/YkuD
MDYLDPHFAHERRYSRPMVAAVRALQADYGINPDGIIGSQALTILNLSDDDRARAIAVAMERLRWLDRAPPPTRIDVNLAAARLTYWRDGKIADSRKVVVGEPDKETPQLAAPIFRLVANPTWTVPRSVQQTELADASDDELAGQNMAWTDGWIVQQSGPKNSLGLVKFDMADDQAIYLHDTPAKALFNLVQRQRSHGCVRVEDALGFAQLIAEDEGIVDEWQQALAAGEETFVKLPRQIPVRLLYQTVLFGDDGTPIIRNDPYNWNDRVAMALGFGASNALGFKAGKGDVGP